MNEGFVLRPTAESNKSGINPSFFTLEVHHGGKFKNFPETRYDGGKVDFVDNVDPDLFSVVIFNGMLEKVGYSKDVIENQKLQFRVPGEDLHSGLRPLVKDTDVLNLIQYVEIHKVIEVYVEFCKDVHQASFVGCFNVDEQLNKDVNVEDEGSDDEDPDFIVDEDNMDEDINVDMDEFRAAVDFDISDEDDTINEHDTSDEDEVDLDDFDSLSESDNDLYRAVSNIRKKKKKSGESLDCPFYVGQAFGDRDDIRVLVKNHAVESRTQLSIIRNDKVRFRVVCLGINPNLVRCESKEDGTKEKENSKESKEDGSQQVGTSKQKNQKKIIPTPTCPWTLHISKQKSSGSWVVKTFVKDHHCLQTRDVRLCTINWIAKEIEPTIQVNPTIPLLALQDLLQKKFQIQVTQQQIFRAKMIATRKIEGDYKAHYEILRDYCKELIRSNPGTTVKIDVESECNPSSQTRQFKRIYICLSGLKEGFKICGRQILGLDGCFMKGPYPGQVLTAVGIDANNGIYPVAYAMVEAETSSSWTWFLECLGEDLDLSCNSNFTFISDRQKGIIPAITTVFPSSEHRYCLRHINENMKQKWKGQMFKNLLWKCATATTLPGFERAMKEVLKQDKALHDWLKDIPPRHWSRAHFSGRAKCDVLLNNLCEVFNSKLTRGRDKPIITCLKYIREYLMKRIVRVHKMIAKCNGPLTPAATLIFEKIKVDASQYNVLWNGASKYQARGPNHDQCIVILEQRTCSCRKWDLTGMPCKHAVACIWNMAQHGLDEGVPEKWVDKAYWLETWKNVYANTIDPINGMHLWTPSECPTTLTAPKYHVQIGRPKKKRKKSAEELSQVATHLSQTISASGKMSRKGNTITCDKCKKKGHNKRTCKGQGSGSQAASQSATAAQSPAASQSVDASQVAL